VSEPNDDLELQALQRRLDDAFETTRPRVGFEDELWLRMQAKRPLTSRIREAFSGLIQGIREVPAVPAAAMAAVLVVLIGVGVIGFSGLLGGHSSEATSAMLGSAADRLPKAQAPGSFGLLPSPSFSRTSAPVAPAVPNSSAAGATYTGQASLTWTGQLTMAITSAPVYRYQEPSTNAADQFATALGAVLQGRPEGFLGEYEATDYTLKVRGTVQTAAAAPAYFVLSAPSMPSISAAGAAPGDIAGLFLAEHSLMPGWQYTVAVEGTGSDLKVRFLRQFATPGYGPASLVDDAGSAYGLEVDLQGTQPVLASGPLPVTLESASYPIISVDQAVQLALASSPASSAGEAAAPSVALNHAALVYVLVPAGDHSFYEPAFLFSGTFQSGGVTYEKRVVVPAVAPAQRG